MTNPVTNASTEPVNSASPSTLATPENSTQVAGIANPEPVPGDPNAGTTTAVAPPIDEYEELTPELVEDEAIRGDFVIKWAVVLLSFLLASTKISESLTLVHIRSGEYVTSHGFVPPTTDVFSSTATDRTWLNLSWGFDVFLSAIYGAGGFLGISIVKALLVMLTFGLIAHISHRNLPTWWSSICAALALLACHLRFAAHSTLVTFLGLATLFYSLHRFRQKSTESPAARYSLWGLVPLFVVWCNFDSRAYLGTACLILYAVGELVQSKINSQIALNVTARRHLLMIAIACVFTTVVHPFHIHSLFAPNFVYGTEYPAIREFVTQSYVGEPKTVVGSSATYFPITYATLRAFEDFKFANGGAVAVVLLAIVVVLFNYRRVVIGEVFALLGMLAFAALSLRELPAAAIVAAIVAGLNGQIWYQFAFSQQYTLDPWELFGSRAGRAITVLALATLAFFGGTGRLRDANFAQTGYGLDNSLASLIGDLKARLVGADDVVPPATSAVSETQDAQSTPPTPPTVAKAARQLDDRPFNFTVGQGDTMIWIGQKPFMDSRLPVYYSANLDDNLLAAHARTREALRIDHSSAPTDSSGGRTLRDREESAKAAERAKRRQYWQSILDKYKITHVVPSLSISSTARTEVGAFTDLLNAEPADWQLTELGAGCAIFYRTDIADGQLKSYLQEHQIDFVDMAFRQGSEFRLSARDRWVRKPNFYQRYLWSERRDISPPIQLAIQYARLATLPGRTDKVLELALPQELAESRAALAFLAIRKAQEGLQDDPDSYWGYMALGDAYSILARWEAALAENPSRTAYTGLRYFEAMAAYNQALVTSPDDIPAHSRLASLYREANRIDLELRHQRIVFDLLNSMADVDNLNLLSIESRIQELEKRVEAAREKDVQYQQMQRARLDRAMEHAQQGFVLLAIEVLNQEAELRTGNLPAEQMRVILQTEAGLSEDAHNNAERFAEPAQNDRMASWQDAVAFANLPNADYPRAQTLWQQKIEQISKGAFSGILGSMVPRPEGLGGWPLSTTSSAINWFFQRPEATCEARLNLALIYLEDRNLVSAQRELELALAANPESPNRNLILHYLIQLRGNDDDLELNPPSQIIPGEFATDEEFAKRELLVDEFAE